MAKSANGEDKLRCSFCGKGHKSVSKLIAGPGVYICNHCIDLCNEIIGEETAGVPTALLQPEGTDEQELERMLALHNSRQQVDRQVSVIVRRLRARGVTWTRIGAALGISRQSAWERYSGEE